MVTCLLASLFFTTPDPLDMPKAEGWIVRNGDRVRIEDRYDIDDLWRSRTVTGRWLEEDLSRALTLADLEFLPPAVGGRMTRADYETTLVRPDRRDPEQLLRQLRAVSPVEPVADFARSRRIPHGLKEVRYYEGTNTQAIVCAFRREKSDRWSAVVWELAEGDDREEMRRIFEAGFFEEAKGGDGKAGVDVGGRSRKKVKPSERELLKRDAAHAVAAYDRWHVTPGDDFVILDDLKDGRAFVASLTNDLAVWRGRFAAALPTEVDVSDTLSVARIYRDRGDYLRAVGEDMKWSAACWCQSRREIVACLPSDGALAELRRTFRHEAFHQYLSYATAMIPTSPWLNEGYAQYFEDGCADTFDARELGLTEEEKWDEAELELPSLLAMDYAQFYAGSDYERRRRYRLAWSVVYFVEHGMREIRHDPFRSFKRQYFAELAKSEDMRRATAAAMGSEDRLKMFCNEWKRFWMNRR